MNFQCVNQIQERDIFRYGTVPLFQMSTVLYRTRESIEVFQKK